MNPNQPQTSRLQAAPRGALVRILLVALSAWFTFAPSPAAAHADLLYSNPAEGSVLDSSPSVITLNFNEQVSALTSDLELRGPSAPVHAAVSADGSVLTIEPRTSLGAGTWSLLWQVESADGHPISGVLRFSVIAESAAPQVVLPSDGVLQDRILELFSWVSVSASLAGLLIRRRSLQMSAAAAVVVFSGLRVVEFLDRSGWTAISLGEFRSTVFVLISGVVLFSPPRAAQLPAALVLYAAQGLFSGHHRLDPLAPVLLALHPVHLAAAALWLSSLLALLLGPNSASDLRRVSVHATASVAALFPAALVLAAAMLVPVHGWGRWEWTITLKAALATVALLFGWMNHVRLRATARSRPASLTEELPVIRRRAALEVLALLLAAAATASIATATPSSLAAPTAAPAADMTPSPSSVVLNLVFDDGSAGRLELESPRVGSRSSAMLYMYDSAGTKLSPVSASWELSNGTARVGGLSGSFVPMGDHLHCFLEFPVDGEYQLAVSVFVDAFASITALTSVQVGS